MKVDNGRCPLAATLLFRILQGPSFSVFRILTALSRLTGIRYFLLCRGYTLIRSRSALKSASLHPGEMIYSLAMDWKHNSTGQHVYASSDHLFLTFQMNRSSGEKEELQNYLMDVDLTTADPAAGKEKPDYTSVRMRNMLHTGARRMFTADELQSISQRRVLYQYLIR